MTADLITGLIVAAAVLTPIGIMWWLAVKAPLGREDSEGFHYGEPDEHADPDNWGA